VCLHTRISRTDAHRRAGDNIGTGQADEQRQGRRRAWHLLRPLQGSRAFCQDAGGACRRLALNSDDEMSWSTFYHTAIWRKLSRQAKERDKHQCQICGDRPGDPYCQLHVHHRVPRSQGGPNTVENLITLCDLCHAVVTKRWHRPWFGEGALWGRDLLGQACENYMWFLSLDPQQRVRIQTAIWPEFGVLPPTR